jgi:hypothetical protein
MTSSIQQLQQAHHAANAQALKWAHAVLKARESGDRNAENAAREQLDYWIAITGYALGYVIGYQRGSREGPLR